MRFWNAAAGLIELELTSAEPEEALTAISESGVEVIRLKMEGDLTCVFFIKRGQYDQLKMLAQKRGESLRLRKRRGLFWIVRRLRNRPVLIGGAIIFLLLIGILPSRVLFIKVVGNTEIPARKILAEAENCGIKFGASRREVRSEKVKNALLSAVPELQWAGVNTSGCIATISVRERTENNVETEEDPVTNIVADRDGYILSGTTVRGNTLYRPGQTVKKGQILISGYTDCGLCIRASRAEGEIFAQTSRKMEISMPSEYTHRGPEISERKKISLLLGKKRIKLWEDSGILDACCGRMYKEYYIALPGGFQLPFALCVDIYTAYESQRQSLPQGDAQIQLIAFAEEYLKEQMVAGQIQSQTQEITSHGGIYTLRGSYRCVEMIGREQRVQIGETNGKSN